jgi:hypothetical protein
MTIRTGFLLMFSCFLSMLVYVDWLQLQGNVQEEMLKEPLLHTMKLFEN